MLYRDLVKWIFSKPVEQGPIMPAEWGPRGMEIQQAFIAGVWQSKWPIGPSV
jgi:hypothetical protein